MKKMHGWILNCYFSNFTGKSIIDDGLPPISRKRSVMPTTSATSDHAEASITEAELGRLSVSTKRQPISRVWFNHNASAYDGKPLTWSCQSAVTAYVRSVLEDLFSAGKFLDLTCDLELSLFHSKPDVVILCEFDVPIGVVEIKMASSTRATPALSKERILGQVFDYLVHLKNYTGRKDVFGILTTYHQWRVIWLPESDEAARSTTTTAVNHIQGPIAQLPSDPPNWSNPDQPNQLPSIPPLQLQKGVQPERHLHGTSIIEWNDPDLPHILLSAIQKMRSSPMNPVSYSELCTDRSYIYVAKDGFQWESVDEEVIPSIEGKVPSHFQHAFLLADLGGGGDGRVWLACTKSGEVCVLKFSKKGDEQRLEKEKQVWKETWNCDVIVKQLNDRPVLVMPWVKPCSEEEYHRDEVQVAVRDAIRTMASAGYMHDDLHWRHVGLYKKDGRLCALLFDLSRTTRINPDQASIDDAIRQMMNELDIQD